MRFRVFYLLALLLAIGLMTSCSWCRGSSAKDSQAETKKTEKPAAQAKPTTTETKAAPNPDSLPDVVAKVNGQDLKKQDLLSHMRMLESKMAQSGQAPPSNRGELVKPALDELIGWTLLFQEGKAKGLVPTKEEVEKQVAEIKKGFANEAEYKEKLKAEGMNPEKLQDEIQFQLTIEKYVETNIIPKVEVKDADLKAFYDSNKEMMKEPEQIHTSHILVEVKKDADAKTKEKARAKAEDVLKKVKAKEDFAALAKANSDDPGSKDKGGDLGFSPKGQFVPEFEKAAWALKPGETSGIVETQFGFHIIKVQELKPERVVPFDEVKENLKGFLKQKALTDKIRSTMEELRSKGKVTVQI
jgi:peptidyl-prolyl cis-trans isomerase C